MSYTSEAEHTGHRPTHGRRWLSRAIGLVVALLALAVVPVSAPSVSAAPELPPSSGWVRFGHFAPGAAEVDVYVDGSLFASDIAFRTVSDYIPIASGAHTFDVRTAGKPDTAPLLSIEAGVPVNSSLTVGAVSTRDGLAPQVYTDRLVQPSPDASLVRFIHAAPDVQAVDVAVVDGPSLATDVPYPDATNYQDVAPGTYDVEVLEAGTDNVVLRVNGWSIAPGVQASIVIVRGADGQIDVAPVQDAVATTATPTGGIQTGGGAMADVLDPSGSVASGPGTWPHVLPLVSVTVAGMLVLLATATVRKRSA